MEIDASKLPVMKSCCKTCPFKLNEKGYFQDNQLAIEVTKRTLFKASQICHGTEGENRKPKNRCKGSFDNNEIIYKRMGFDFDNLRKLNNEK